MRLRIVPARLGIALVCLGLAPALLSAESYVTGQVFERQGSGFVPVAGARIEARVAGETAAQDGVETAALGSVETGSMGRYYLGGLPAGALAVTVSHPRYYAVRDAAGSGAETVVCCPGSGPCGQVDFEMLPAGELEVLVVDSLGLPVESASVQIQRLDEPARTFTPAVRSVGGVFRTAGMLPGRYRIEAQPVELRKGIRYHQVGVELSYPYGQEHESVRLVLPSQRLHRVSGRILGLDAADAARALVLLESAPEDAGGNQQQLRIGAPLGPHGEFAVNGVPRGSFSLKLCWAEETQLDLAHSPSHLLATIQVASDLPGLLFAAPADPGLR